MWVGAVVSRSAGCIVNDIWDKEFDKHVERTKQRPLASGELTVNQAWAFFVPHVFVGLGVLTQMNWLSIKWILGILPVCFLYPAAKRVTNYPQAVLGKIVEI
jgi:4-hydroxybenzoate polyprenyltransferase and related prenyltransferases